MKRILKENPILKRNRGKTDSRCSWRTKSFQIKRCFTISRMICRKEVVFHMESTDLKIERVDPGYFDSFLEEMRKNGLQKALDGHYRVLEEVLVDASISGNIEIVREILTEQPESLYLVLETSINNKQEQLALYLLERQFQSLEGNLDHLLELSISNKLRSVVSFFVKQPTANRTKAFFSAVKTLEDDLVRDFLEHINLEDTLLLAAAKDEALVVESVIKLGAKNLDDALHEAALVGASDVIHVLISHGAKNWEKIFDTCVKGKHYAAVGVLLEAGIPQYMVDSAIETCIRFRMPSMLQKLWPRRNKNKKARFEKVARESRNMIALELISKEE